MVRQIEYFNARVWGMADALLTAERHQALLQARTRDEWVSALRETPYGAFFGPSLDPGDNRALYRAVDASIASRTHRLTGITPGNPVRALRVCLADMDLQNLITVTTGICNHADPADILSGTIAGGLLGGDQLEALSKGGSLVETADILATWGYAHHAAYRKSLGKHPDRPLTEVRLDLNRNFMEVLLADARRCGFPVIYRFMREKIDRINLMTTLMWRALPSDRDPGEFFLSGGCFVSEEIFRKMLAASDLWEAVDCLPQGPFRKSAIKAAQDQAGLERISLFESCLEKWIIHRYTRPLTLDPLGAELLLSYLLRLRTEGVRLKQSLTRLLLEIPVDLFMEMTAYV